MNQRAERIGTVVVGAGQAGLSVGFHLSRRGMEHVILDANERVGDSWRTRWDSLRLFTPARYDGLEGMPFPAPNPHYFPTKDEFADYLESYAVRFDLPVRTATRVTRVAPNGNGFLVETSGGRIETDNVVVAMANYQWPKVPAFATELDPGIVRFHSIDYRDPSQLQDGDVLLVGAGNTGSELAMELCRDRKVWMSGRDVGAIPFRIEGRFARLIGVRLVIRFLFHRVITMRTPVGRKVRPKVTNKGGPLIRVKPKDLEAAGVERVPKVAGVEDGRPVLEDGRVLDVANVIWCTGFDPGFDWIDLPIHGDHEPRHKSGIVPDVPGLYFVGLHFLHALSSAMIHGVSRDAGRIVDLISSRSTADGRGIVRTVRAAS